MLVSPDPSLSLTCMMLARCEMEIQHVGFWDRQLESAFLVTSCVVLLSS